MFLAIFDLSLFTEVFYMFSQLQVVQMVPNAEDFKHPILSCFTFKAKFEYKKKTKQSEGSSKPSITPFLRKDKEEPVYQSKDKKKQKKEKLKEKSSKREEKKESFQKTEHVSYCFIYFRHEIYFIIVCYV